jgi:hypothetical protein
MTIAAGYTGYADIAGVGGLRFSSASVGIAQDVIIPDMAEGTRYRYGYAMGGAVTQGSISGPLIAGQVGALWAAAKAAAMTTVSITYYAGATITMECIINSFSFSVSAGDVAQYSMDFMGMSTSGGGGGGGGPVEDVLLTWDKINYGGACEVQAIEVSLSNNCTPVYGLNQSDLWPCTILPGKLTVTGSITYYGIPGDMDAQLQLGGEVNENLIIYDNVPNMDAIYHAVSPSGSVGPVVYTQNFTCVGD